MTRTKWALASALAITSILFASLPALAVDPPTLTQTVTDQTGKLDGGADRIASAASALKSENDLTFYTLWIPQLDGEDPAQFIDRVAAANKLGDGRNVLFMVSLNDRKDAVWSSGLTSIDTGELDGIRQAAEQQLKAGDFVGAVEAAAVGFGNAEVGAAPAPQQPSQPATPSEPLDLSFIGYALVIILVAGVAVTVLALGYSAWRKRATERATARAEHDKMEALGKSAHIALMETDELYRQAEQDEAFAETEFGADEMASFREALVVAKKQLTEAFKVGQEIDDDKPETYEERSRMLTDITSKTSGIKAALEAAKEAVDRLRDLEHTAAATVQTLIAQRPDRVAALTAAQGQIDRLKLHGQSVVESVEPSIGVVTALHAAVDKDLADAEMAVTGGNLADAALAVRNAQDSLTKAKDALDNIVKLAASLDEAERNLDVEIQSADAEIVNATTAVRDGAIKGFAGQLAEAVSTLARAKAEAVAEHADTIVAYNLALKANGLADQVLEGVRTAQEKERRAIEEARAQIRAADVAIAQANAYIAAHRTTVGRKARNRLSEAQRAYEGAHRVGDGSTDSATVFVAAAAAIQANEMADAAYRYARQDVSDAAAAATPQYNGGSSSSSGSSYGSSSSSGGSYSSPSSSSSGSYSHHDNSFSSGSFGGGHSSGGSFGGGGGHASGGGW